MKNFQLSSAIRVITRPNNTFREIFEDVDNYFKASIIIFILSSIFYISFTVPSESISKLPTNEIGYILDAEIQVIGTVLSISGGFLSIVLIFYVGKLFGGSKNFRGVFSVLSYSLIPMLIGGILVSIFLYYPPLLEYVSGIDSKDPGFRMLYWVLYFGIFFPFVIWSFILSIKAIKIANNFGTGKTLGIIILTVIISAVI